MREGGTPSLACTSVLFWLRGRCHKCNYRLHGRKVKCECARKRHAKLVAQQARQLRNKHFFRVGVWYLPFPLILGGLGLDMQYIWSFSRTLSRSRESSPASMKGVVSPKSPGGSPPCATVKYSHNTARTAAAAGSSPSPSGGASSLGSADSSPLSASASPVHQSPIDHKAQRGNTCEIRHSGVLPPIT